MVTMLKDKVTPAEVGEAVTNGIIPSGEKAIADLTAPLPAQPTQAAPPPAAPPPAAPPPATVPAGP